MGYPFDITAGKIEKENNKKIITVSNNPIYHNNKCYKSKIMFRTELRYLKHDNIINFLLKVEEKGYLKFYLQSIKEFFELSLDLDVIFESWNESHKDAKQAIKLYKKKTLTKNNKYGDE